MKITDCSARQSICELFISICASWLLEPVPSRGCALELKLQVLVTQPCLGYGWTAWRVSLFLLHSVPTPANWVGVGNRLDGDRASRADLNWTKGCSIDMMPFPAITNFVTQGPSHSDWLGTALPLGVVSDCLCITCFSSSLLYFLNCLVLNPSVFSFLPSLFSPRASGAGGRGASTWVDAQLLDGVNPT